MTKIYLVTRSIEYEGSEIQEVCSSEQVAREVLQKLFSMTKYGNEFKEIMKNRWKRGVNDDTEYLIEEFDIVDKLEQSRINQTIDVLGDH